MKRTIQIFFFPILLLMGLFPHESRAEMPAIDPAATEIFKRMSDYIVSQGSIELTFNSDIEIITPQLEKIQFTNSGTALLSRPNNLYAHRTTAHADVKLFYDGKTVSIYEKKVNGYVQFDAPDSIDQFVEEMREGEGIALPGADLLLTNSYDVLIADTMEAKYIGRGVIDGRECEHLAFRNFDTDWQLWVQAGDKPIPCKMVITSKTMNSAPQYTLHVKSWNEVVAPEQDFFDFTPPAGAKELNHDALIGFDELPPDTTERGNQ
jgi:hypothetical protein